MIQTHQLPRSVPESEEHETPVKCQRSCVSQETEESLLTKKESRYVWKAQIKTS